MIPKSEKQFFAACAFGISRLVRGVFRSIPPVCLSGSAVNSYSAWPSTYLLCYLFLLMQSDMYFKAHSAGRNLLDKEFRFLRLLFVPLIARCILQSMQGVSPCVILILSQVPLNELMLVIYSLLLASFFFKALFPVADF